MQDRPVGWSAGLYSAGIGAGSAGDRPAELAAQVRFGAQDRPAGLAAQVTRLAVQAEALLVNLQVRGHRGDPEGEVEAVGSPWVLVECPGAAESGAVGWRW